jgi:predicted Zn finger-like uncharacterized protein
MILTCPQCSTRYHVDPTSVAPEGRMVRCASCGNRWRAKPPADAPRQLELKPATPAVTTAPRRPGAATGASRARGRPGIVTWLVGALVVLVAASAVIGRNEIVAAFPASEAVYRTLGLPLTVQLGLQFADVTSRRLSEGGIAVLVVEGKIVNLSEQDRTVPPIRMTLLDGGGRQLQEELLEAEHGMLSGGGETSFSGRIVNPADQAQNFSLTFEIES